jgi:hypothetical protein
MLKVVIPLACDLELNDSRPQQERMDEERHRVLKECNLEAKKQSAAIHPYKECTARPSIEITESSYNKFSFFKKSRQVAHSPAGATADASQPCVSALEWEYPMAYQNVPSPP